MFRTLKVSYSYSNGIKSLTLVKVSCLYDHRFWCNESRTSAQNANSCRNFPKLLRPETSTKVNHFLLFINWSVLYDTVRTKNFIFSTHDLLVRLAISIIRHTEIGTTTNAILASIIFDSSIMSLP